MIVNIYGALKFDNECLRVRGKSGQRIWSRICRRKRKRERKREKRRRLEISNSPSACSKMDAPASLPLGVFSFIEFAP